MFHKIKNVSALPEYRLSVQFAEGVTKLYDVKPLFERQPVFKRLIDTPEEFGCVSIDVGGYGLVWGDGSSISPATSCGKMVCRSILPSMV